jgi:integrase
MREIIPYKLPTICRCKSGEWYIQYHYEYPDKPGKFKPFKVKDGVNRIHDLKEKEAYARDLVKDITYWLEKLDYNPFNEKKDIVKQAYTEIKKKETPPNWTLTEAISKFRAHVIRQKLSDRTIKTYNNYLYNLEGYLKEFPEHDIEAYKFTEYDLVAFLDIESDELEWSARTYNNYIEFYRTFFNRCKKLEKAIHRQIKYEFDMDGIELKNTTPQKNKAYTPVLRRVIKDELKKPAYKNLRDYIEWIYLSLMRPSEIRNLKVLDIDEEKRQIRILGKTGDRLIPISDQLLKLIEKRQLMSSNINHYIFGMAGGVSNMRMSKDYLPGKFTEIKLKLALDKNYTLYAWKHTGVIDMIYAGFEDKEIMVLTGHKTKEAFNAYTRDLVIDNSHVMKGATIDF